MAEWHIKAEALFDEGKTVREVAEFIGISYNTTYKALVRRGKIVPEVSDAPRNNANKKTDGRHQIAMKILEMAESGKNVREISDTLGEKYGTVHAVLTRHGVKTRQPNAWHDEVEALYRAGVSSTEIMKKFGAKKSTIHSILRIRGLHPESRNLPTEKKLGYIYMRMLEMCRIKKDLDIKVDPAMRPRKKFIAWALENGYEYGLSLCRKDISADFTPENCFFGTVAEGLRKSNALEKIAAIGLSMSAVEWAELLHLNPTTMGAWKRKGQEFFESKAERRYKELYPTE